MSAMFERRVLVLTLLFVCGLARADADLQQFLEQTVGNARTSSGVPAVAALIQRNGKIEAQVASGVRATGHRETVTLKDQWHLGSCTKAMTATLVARLVEQGYLDFDDTMARIFPGIAARMHPDLHSVTVIQLLTHTSGLAPLTSPDELPAFMAVIKAEDRVRAQRAAVAVHYLSRPPASKAGQFVYSNLGYVIVGAIVEQRTGRTWEELIRDEVWKPLGIRDAGFGPPGHAGRYDQPLGHEWDNDLLKAMPPDDPDSDNPVAIGPAGTVYMRLTEWLAFAQDHLDGEHGKGKLLTPESYRRLHSAVGRNYAMGWGTLRAADGSLDVLTHAGSNGYWMSDVRIFPKRNLIFLTAMNAGGDRAQAADRDINKALTERLKPLD
jgi:CubicO group peptidase (beta-lactamase class C family)